MESLQILSVFVVNVVLLALLPGPDNIFVAIQSISYGKKQGLATVAGLVTGCLFHTTLVAVGISALIKRSPFMYSSLVVLGALYLFFLAYKVYRSEIQVDLEVQKNSKKSLRELYKQGIFMNVLNPKVGLFFLAFFPAFLFSNTYSVFWQFVILGLIFSAITFLVFGLISFTASSLKNYIQKYPKVTTYVKWAQFLVFVALGIFILGSHKY